MLKQVLYLKVTVAGRVDPTTGMVLNISDLKVHLIIISQINMVWFTSRHLTKKVWIQKVLKKIDHHNIDKEVEPFTEGQVVNNQSNSHFLKLFLFAQVSTAENIAVWLWNEIQPVIPPPAALYEVQKSL